MGEDTNTVQHGDARPDCFTCGHRRLDIKIDIPAPSGIVRAGAEKINVGAFLAYINHTRSTRPVTGGFWVLIMPTVIITGTIWGRSKRSNS